MVTRMRSKSFYKLVSWALFFLHYSSNRSTCVWFCVGFFAFFGRPGDVDGLTGSDHLVQHVVIVTPASGRSPEHSLSTVAEAAYSALSVSSTPLKVSKPSAKQSTSRPATSTTSQEALSGSLHFVSRVILSGRPN